MARIFKGLSVGLVLLAIVLSAGSENILSGTVGADRPNIIFILTDDLDDQNLDRQAQGLGIPLYRGLRTKDYLYVEYNTGERELYDLGKDPL